MKPQRVLAMNAPSPHDPNQKRKLAVESLEFNCKNPAFRKFFPELVELHERRKKEAAEEGARLAGLGGDSREGVSG